MTWLRRYRLRRFLRSSLWAAPVAAIFLAVACARVMRFFDDYTHWKWFDFTPDGARAILSSFVAAMLSFVVVVASALLLVVQLASAQFTPRIIAPTIQSPVIRVAMSIFVFTFASSISVLGRIEDRVPQLATLFCVVLNTIAMVMFLYFVGALGLSLRPVALLVRMAERGRREIFAAYPERYSDNPSDPDPEIGSPAAGATAVVVHPGPSGVLLAYDTDELVQLATAQGAMFELIPRVGDFLAGGEPLFTIYGSSEPDIAEMQQMIAFGPERTLDQDPAFAIRIIVDVANKALSPAINDPTTAVLAIDQLQRLLRWIGLRELSRGKFRDRAGNVRLCVRTTPWDDFVWLAVAEIRQFGGSSAQVCKRLRSMLESLIQLLPPARHPPLREQLRLLDESIARFFPAVEDRLYLGLGSDGAARTIQSSTD